MTESENGGKLVNKLVRRRETVVEEEGAAVCQGWGSILLGVGRDRSSASSRKTLPLSYFQLVHQLPLIQPCKRAVLDLNPPDWTHAIKNSAVFAEMIHGIQITPSDRLVSYDVTSLFTQVPIDEALRVVEEQLTKDQTLGERTNIPVSQLVKLVELCLRKTYFQFQEDFFEQTDGAAMGSPL